MMKRKLLIGSIAGLFVLGGAMGAGAASKSADVNSAEKTANIISTKDAEEIAINEFGGKLKSIELEKDDGHFIYDIELLQKNGEDIDLDLNAVSGKIIKIDRHDDDNDDEYDRSNKIKNVTLTIDDAISTAIEDTPGKVVDAEYDEDGYYDIEMKIGQNEVEMKIDANSGKIIEKENDDD